MSAELTNLFYHRGKRILFEGTITGDKVYPILGSVIAYNGPRSSDSLYLEPKYWDAWEDLDTWYLISECSQVHKESNFEKFYNKCTGI